MAEFSQLIITNKGQALIAKVLAGTGDIEFTKVDTSETEYQLDALQNLTELTGVKQTSLVSKVSRTNDVAITVEAAFTNTGLTFGYYVKTLGLYATDPDEGEILYAVSIEQSGNCYIPASNGTTVTGLYLKFVTTVGNADNISLEVNPAAFALVGDIQDLQSQIDDLETFLGYSGAGSPAIAKEEDIEELQEQITDINSEIEIISNDIEDLQGRVSNVEAFIGYIDNDVYGLEVNFMNNNFVRLAGAMNKTAGADFDSINAFGGRKRCIMTNDGVVLAYYGEAGYTTSGALTEAIDIGDTTYPIGTIVQVMVEQPKFYYKVVPMLTENKTKGQIIRKARYYVSDTAREGFKVHPAFVCNGVENDKIYLAAYEGSLYDASANSYITNDAQVADFGNDMLCSISGAKPLSGVTQNATRANVRMLARKRGAGWEQSYAATVCASELLMLIEYASFNMQTAIGAGNTNKESGTGNHSENTGATDTLGNASGAILNSNSVQLVSYRGEENFWGNIWTWIDGINSNINVSSGVDDIYITDHDFTDDIDDTSGIYQEVEITPSMTEGYVSAFCYDEDFDWLFIAGEVTGNSALPVGDYFYQSETSGWRVGLLGGTWNDGADAGAFCWALRDASSYRSRDVGGRLVYVPSNAA